MIKKYLLFLSLFLLCVRLPRSVGKSKEVIVIASKIDTTLIVSNLQIYNYLPQKEALFSFVFASDTALKNYKKFHTQLLFGSLQDDFVYTMLNEEAQETIKKDTFALFKLNDLGARGQITIILATYKPEYFERGILKYRSLISKILEDNYYNQIKENYYRAGIDKKLTRELSKYGFTFDLGESWMIDSTYKNENFIFIHIHFPDRSIFFYKEKADQKLTDSLVFYKRNALTNKYYNGDYILKEMAHIDPIEFHDFKGIRLKGIWQNDSLVAGGPFISYFLTRDDTLYVIDGMVFNPGERKSDYLTKIEVIMNSFKIINP